MHVLTMYFFLYLVSMTVLCLEQLEQRRSGMRREGLQSNVMTVERLEYLVKYRLHRGVIELLAEEYRSQDRLNNV